MLTRGRAVLGSGDAGVTLIELLVGMTLMVVVGVIGLSTFVVTTNQSSTVTEQSLVGATARSAMNVMTGDLRLADTSLASAGSSANRFVTIQPTDLKFFSDVSSVNRNGSSTRSAPLEVEFTLISGVLWQYTYTPSTGTPPASYPTAASSKAALTTRNVTVTNLSFTYCSDATDPSTSCTPTTSAPSVAFVQISLTVKGLMEFKGAAQQTVQTGVAVTGALS